MPHFATLFLVSYWTEWDKVGVIWGKVKEMVVEDFAMIQWNNWWLSKEKIKKWD